MVRDSTTNPLWNHSSHNSYPGKTVLLLYILLHRLEHRLPTAVQFESDAYVVFKSDGVFLCRLTDPIDHWLMLPDGCWCLTDGNAYVAKPCEPFTQLGFRILLITPPNPDGYRKWANQVSAQTVITDLPRAVEVAAIAYVRSLLSACHSFIHDLFPHSMMNGFDPRDAISVVRKWGPNTRTVLSILGDTARPSRELEQERHVVDAAIDINKDPSKVVGQLPNGQGSALFFIKPIRSNDHDYITSQVIIPTMHLSEIFDSKCDNLSALDMMRLHEFLAMQSVMNVAEWRLKKNMHLQTMSMVRNRHEIFNGTAKFYMYSAAGVLVGTASALRAAARNKLSSFYWFPSVVRLPGIDSVLVSGNNIFTLQATITDTHDGPHIGLKNIWHMIGAEQARHFTWHFVVVTNNKSLADKYAKDFGTQLRDVTLGPHPYVRVSVWACVLDSSVQNGDGESPLAAVLF